MSETTADQTQRTGRTPRASLGSPEGDDVFGVFDTRIARRFFSYLGPHRKLFVGAQSRPSPRRRRRFPCRC